MAAQISISTRRGVLSELNVNSPIGGTSWSKTSKLAGGAEKPALIGEKFLRPSIEDIDMVDAVYKEAGSVGSERQDSNLDENEQRSPEWHNADISSVPRHIPEGGRSAILRGHHGGSISDETKPVSSSVTPARSHTGPTQTSSPESTSPSSSNGFSETALNDTQITEPDESRVILTLTQAELREKAHAMRLRLRLATYKVRTNQTGLPMSRLQIKTTKFDLERLPTPRGKVTKLQRRTPLPSARTSPRTSNPSIQLQKPSADKLRRPDIISSSPPQKIGATSPPHSKKMKPGSPSKECEETREEIATPLLPRHRQGLLNPPNLGSPKSPGSDLTSSVVKRGTADVLLSLKLQR